MEEEWAEHLAALPVWRPEARQLLVVSPHPDDETLAVGGLIASSREAGTRVVVIAVTDGENAYGEDRTLGRTRQAEQESALNRLGVAPGDIVRLRLTDSDVAAGEDSLLLQIAKLSSPETLVLAPWPGDFHPDHVVSGRAATEAARLSGAALAFYFFWTWHRGTPDTLTGLQLHRFPLDPNCLATKLEALACHRSQLTHSSGAPILPESLLGPARRSFEVILPA